MDKKEFKKTLTSIFDQYGFKYVNKAYYNSNEEIIIVIATQKSNFTDTYYINFGFLIKEETSIIEYPKDNLCDISGRFVYTSHDDKITDSINIGMLDNDSLEKIISKNIETKILPTFNYGLLKYFENYPEAIYTANLKVKKYLGID